ncbi:MAG: hypothetical protein JO202_00280 [Ktedonobacteraceae bacterium]|nr:hypothetical protein [Ktedonobacteraceae bacterium]
MKRAPTDLAIEYQETELAFYTMEWAEDNRHIKEVKTGTSTSDNLGQTWIAPTNWKFFPRVSSTLHHASRMAWAGREASAERYGDNAGNKAISEQP